MQRAPWPSSVLGPSAPFQHLYLAVCVTSPPMSPPGPTWAGSAGLVLVSTGADPQQGGRTRKWMAPVQLGWQRAQRPLPGGRLPSLPGLFSRPRQPRAHHRRGRAGPLGGGRVRGRQWVPGVLACDSPLPVLTSQAPLAPPAQPSDHVAKTGRLDPPNQGRPPSQENTGADGYRAAVQGCPTGVLQT